MHVPAAQARQRAFTALRRAGAPEPAARTQVELLLEADLRGHASHGLARLPRLLHRIRRGLADPHTTGHHEWRGTAALVVDGQRGLGPVVGQAALNALLDRVPGTGVAVAAIANSNHLGMLAWYVETVAAAGRIAIAMSTSEALVHPHGGRTALVGTNPLAIAVPAEPEPLVVDLATSIVSMGKIHDHRQRGEPIPLGWALDADGTPTTDPAAAADGSIAPFGDAKGYALGLAIEVLVASLTDAALGTDVRGTLDATEVCNKGDVFIVLDPGRSPDIAARIGAYLDIVRSCPPADPAAPVTVPGDRTRAARQRRLHEGISLPEEVWAELSTDGKDDS